MPLFYLLQLVHFFAKPAYAGVSPLPPTISPVGTPTGASSGFDIGNSLNGIFNVVFPVLTTLVGIAAVLYVIYAGIQYITSVGSPDKIKQAQGTLVNAILGVIIVVAAYFIIRLASSLGASLYKFI